ncbi:hypothetical protein [Streptosporangium sp. NPDC051022]|uniref:DODA-type extradiol aromatic ring-opening family dioxygenase n=1 Tax=Streptosporangium sp. NPDC051022 TaxID=3155752 RepID=UPI00341457AD
MSGSVVAVQALSHTAFVNTHRDKAPADQAERFFAGAAEAGRRLRAAAPDAVVMIATDHANNFGPANIPAVCIGTGARHSGPIEAERALAPARTQRGGADIALELVTHLLGSGLPVSRGAELALDHSMLVPLSLLELPPDLPVIPVYQNCVAPPLPSLEGCWHFGRRLLEAISHTGARIAVVGSGGLSHWVAMSRQGEINTTWDRRVLELCSGGRIAEALAWDDHEVLATGGNGAHELRNWVAALACADGRPAEVLAYEPVTEWLTGMAVVDVPGLHD